MSISPIGESGRRGGKRRTEVARETDSVALRDTSARWVIASLLFVDPRISTLSGRRDASLQGAKHILVFSGHNSASLYSRIRRWARKIEEQFSELASAEWVQNVPADSAPYRPTKFLGFEDIAWTLEPIRDGAVLCCGNVDTEVKVECVSEVIDRASSQKSVWYTAEVAAKVSRLGSPREQDICVCLAMFRAKSPQDGIDKAAELLSERRRAGATLEFSFVRICQFSAVDDPEVRDGAEILYFTTRHTVNQWESLIKARRHLSIFKRGDVRDTNVGSELDEA